jgi:cell wall-associated NlpC family hydrolase
MYSRLRSKIPLWLLLSGFLALQACTVFTPGLISANIQRERQFRKEIIAYSQKYLGLPYRYASRDPEVGFDCSGFTHFVMKNFDIALSTSSSAQSLEGIKVPLEEVQPGDLVFFRHSPRGRIFHVALVVSNEEEGINIIHATFRGIMIDNLKKSSYWSRKYKSARRVIL